jgi:hypothetical protein
MYVAVCGNAFDRKIDSRRDISDSRAQKERGIKINAALPSKTHEYIKIDLPNSTGGGWWEDILLLVELVACDDNLGPKFP